VPGDIITALAGHSTQNLAALDDVVAGLQSGSTLTADIITLTGRRESVSVVLAPLGS
jgi:hypothetical protein